MRFSHLVPFCFVASLVGCAPKATFDMSVTNRTDRPITVGMVKDGPPFEAEWASPEELVLRSSLEMMPPWGHVIPPGRTMDSPAIAGDFSRGATAYLRVYAGEHSNAELLATSAASPDRTEILLFPGHNEVVVERDGRQLRVQRIRANSAPAPR